MWKKEIEMMGKFGVQDRNVDKQVMEDITKWMEMAVVKTFFQTWCVGGHVGVHWTFCSHNWKTSVSVKLWLGGVSVATQDGDVGMTGSEEDEKTDES